MKYGRFKFLNIRIDQGVAFVTIDNPPMNLLNMELIGELNRLQRKIVKDENVRVIVFDSADPDFFIAHFDVSFLAILPDEPIEKPEVLTGLHPVCEAFRTMPKISIAKLEGIARGGGSEFVLALDMRFGAIGKTILGQPEIVLGIIPGGGGTQRLPRLMGRSRAMETILGGIDFTAELAEKYGYINRAFPSDELTSYVEELAYRIASFPAESIALAKRAVLTALEQPLTEGLLEEMYLFGQSCALPAAKERMNWFLQRDGQTREKELGQTDLLSEWKSWKREH
ncbi:MAG: enoyl-CoA hydratase/isomerase family protein [Promethearchaeota archaeon]|nr:MAG: enoyl-CoA hydratase/isomerase family protein [Candidatus Lokiarchaeota archaeon]